MHKETVVMISADDMTESQKRNFDAWVYSVRFHNPNMSKNEAHNAVLDRINDSDKPYRWNENHWCPGYYDCIHCAP